MAVEGKGEKRGVYDTPQPTERPSINLVASVREQCASV
jgi:hypothetical protein